MSIAKPFHRMVRGHKQSANSGYSSWAYIRDKHYAKAASHYVRAFSIIQSDLQKLFEYIEPDDDSLGTYSYRVHELLMRTCIEIEANFKAILNENHCSVAPHKQNMSIYEKVNTTHHLSSYEVILPIWNGSPRIWKPYESWTAGKPLPWYQAYNASKHDRQEEFKQANFHALMLSVSGLLVLLSSQFRTEDFSAGGDALGLAGDEYHEMEPAIGSLFRIKFPEDWAEEDLYDFDWSVLKLSTDRFAKFDYDAL